MAAKQQSHHRSKPSGTKSKGGGNSARSARASRAKQATRASAGRDQGPVSLDQGARCESLIMLKNLAKLLVDRIEAACAARNYTSQVSNPNTATGARLVHGTNSGSDPSVSIEYGSSIDVDDSKEKVDSPYLSTQKHSGHLGDFRSSPDTRARNRRDDDDDDDDDAHQCVRGGHRDLDLESHSAIQSSSSMCDRSDSRPRSRPNPSAYTRSEVFFRDPDSRPSSRPDRSGNTSRPDTREWTASPRPESRANAASCMRKLSVPLKKVDVGVDDCEMPPRKDRVHRTPRRKIRSPGLRSLVVPQAKNAPANTKLVLHNSRHTEGLKSTEDAGSFEPEELYKAVWADVVQDVFDEIFTGEEEPSHEQSPSSAAQLSAVPRTSAEWIIQTQSIKYRSWGPERSSSTRGGSQYLKIPGEEPTSTSTESSRRAKEGVKGKAPVILPTFAKYHMDKIERYKKGVAEKQLREQKECRPSAAPDPYNVLNVYAERCALLRSTSSQKSTHVLDWQIDVDNHPDQPNSVSSERVSTKTRQGSKATGQISRKYQHIPEVDKLINLRQETGGAVNLDQPRSKFEEKLLQTKNRIITSQNQSFLNGARKNLQATEAVSKKTRFRDHWPFLNRQIEAFIQAHILQCCILFKNVPLVFPTLEYQEEIQRLYSDRPLST